MEKIMKVNPEDYKELKKLFKEKEGKVCVVVTDLETMQDKKYTFIPDESIKKGENIIRIPVYKDLSFLKES